MGAMIIYKKLIGALTPHTPATPPVTYATWNPSACGTAIGLSGGNLTTLSTGIGSVRATIPVASGNKRYWEYTIGAGTINMTVGIDNGSGNLSNYTGADVNSFGLYGYSGYSSASYILNGPNQYSPYHGLATGNVVGVALDLVGNTIQFYINGTANGAALAIPSGSYYPAMGAGGSGTGITANFGASAFAYTVPSGFTGGVY